MNLQSLSPSRIFNRGKRSTGTKAERVESLPLQERFLRGIPAEAQEDASHGAVLAEAARAGCERSAAGATVFVP